MWGEGKLRQRKKERKKVGIVSELVRTTECPLYRSRGLQPGKRHHPSQEFAKQKLMENNVIYLLT